MLEKNQKLSERVAVVTGGLGTLGYQHCRALLALGARVIIWDSSLENETKVKTALIQEFPDASLTIEQVDVSNAESVKKASEKIEKVHILINNAAINPKYPDASLSNSRVENLELDDWNLQLSVGLTGAFLCSKHLGSKMAKSGDGIIVNIASDLSIISPDQRLYKKANNTEENQPVKPITYSVIKTGLIGLTRYLSTYWAEFGVRVNAISPGGVFENQSNEFQERLTQRIPMGRMASQDEYVGVIQFLCTDMSRYMTGQNIVMDGGRSVW